MSSAYQQGSIWRKWDLHVHTPASHTAGYGGDTDAAWENFIKDIENLSSDIKVLGINDYIFLDGYKKTLDFKNKGRLNNIDIIFPVVEFRLKEFVGHEKLRKLNFHIIFADISKLTAEQIEAQFLNGLSGVAKLDPGLTNVTWGGIITKQSLSDLGRAIRNTTPAEKKNSLVSNDFDLGFNNINFELSKIEELLGETGTVNTYLKENYLKAIGKSEWEDYRWDDISIADKKSVINGCHFIFCAATSEQQAINSKQKLVSQGVNARLLHCSDAHFLTSSASTDRKLGVCFSWIKADPTFEGLKQILNEFEDRVFLGTVPPSIQRAIDRSTRVIKTVEVNKIAGATIREKWFHQILLLNPELVAIIGNKGSGKSALADILGLLGNTPRFKSFSFLRADRFRDPKGNKAKQFQAELIWLDGKKEGPVLLDSNPSPESIEKIKYIPQNYLEEICNEIELGKGSRFYTELQDVIFSHVPDAERLGFTSLDELLDHRSKETNQAIDLLVKELFDLNQHIVVMEERLSPQHRKILESQLAEKNREFEAHENTQPREMIKPSEDAATQKKSLEIATQLEDEQRKLNEIELKITEVRKNDSESAHKLATAEKLLTKFENIQRQVTIFMQEIQEGLKELGLDNNEMISFKTNTKSISKLIEEITAKRKEYNSDLNIEIPTSLIKQRSEVITKIEQFKSSLSAPQKEYQAYLQRLKEWQSKKGRISGTTQLVGSIEYLKFQLSELIEVPKLLKRASLKRDKKTLEIFREKLKLQRYYSIYYGTVQEFLTRQPLAVNEQFKLKFKVSIVQSGFVKNFLNYIDQRKEGPFAGIEQGGTELKQLIDETDWNSAKKVLRFARQIFCTMRNCNNQLLDIKDQLKKGQNISVQDVYNFVFSLVYISPIYRLQWDGKEIEQLSPGERGNLLLIFYLIIDRDDIPLVIDQPEENLDNHTVYKTLVPCIKDAKKRRQIIIVTHNPNLAVVCDAEQIISSEIHKDQDNEVCYLSGSIENPEMNKKIVDILEGTRPAFDKRDAKYQ